MGVILDGISADSDAPSRTDAEQSSTDDAPPVPDPFLQQYRTDLFETDDETLNEMLTLVIATANVFK